MTPILSIRQPWAWLILHAGKDIENRNWPTDVRGRILIHAAKGMTRDEYDDAYDTFLAIMRRDPRIASITFPEFTYFDDRRGGIVGSAELFACVETHASPWFFGRYGFALRDPKPLPFHPMKGQLGFFQRADAPRP